MEILDFLKINSNSGSGLGDGDGNGTDYGTGYGNSSGDGDGDGSGYGDGDGSGYGYEDGEGDGNGYGYDLKSINKQSVYVVDDIETIITSIKNNIAKGFIVQADLTLKPCYIVRVGDCFAHGETIKQAVKDAEIKALSNIPIEEKVEKFWNTFE